MTLAGVSRHDLVEGVVTIGVVSPLVGVNGEGLFLGLISVAVVRPSVSVDGSGLSLGLITVGVLRMWDSGGWTAIGFLWRCLVFGLCHL
jgi:hypothetical protein